MGIIEEYGDEARGRYYMQSCRNLAVEEVWILKHPADAARNPDQCMIVRSLLNAGLLKTCVDNHYRPSLKITKQGKLYLKRMSGCQ